MQVETKQVTEEKRKYRHTLKSNKTSLTANKTNATRIRQTKVGELKHCGN